MLFDISCLPSYISSFRKGFFLVCIFISVCVCAYTTVWQISNTYIIHMCIYVYSCVYGSYVNCIMLNRQPSYFLAHACITDHVSEDLINTWIWSCGSWWHLVGESSVRPMVECILGLKEITRQGTGLIGISLLSTMCFCSNRKLPTVAICSYSIHLAILPE